MLIDDNDIVLILDYSQDPISDVEDDDPSWWEKREELKKALVGSLVSIEIYKDPSLEDKYVYCTQCPDTEQYLYFKAEEVEVINKAS